MANKKETGRDQEQQLLDIYETLAPSQKHAFILGRIYALLMAGNDNSDMIQSLIDEADEDLKKIQKQAIDTVPRKKLNKKDGEKDARKKRS